MTWEGDPRTSTAQWRATRTRILRRDHHTCQRCGAPANTVDHIINVAAGGTDHDTNLQSLCDDCHAAKTSAEGNTTRWRYPQKRPAPPHPGLRRGGG